MWCEYVGGQGGAVLQTWTLLDLSDGALAQLPAFAFAALLATCVQWCNCPAQQTAAAAQDNKS